MSRSAGVVEAIRALLTEPVLLLAALVTLAGDAGTLLAISLGAYWLAAPAGETDGESEEAKDGGRGVLDRDRGAFLFACALGAFSLTAGLKALFALSRPSIALLTPGAFETAPAGDLLRAFVASAASASGYGFPSGHAIGATVVYGALALVMDIGTRRGRWVAAGLLIVSVSLSRVVLGVHYLVDVLVGIVVALAFLAIVAALARGTGGTDGVDVRRTFALAVALGTLATIAAIGDAPRDALTLLGVSGGAMGAWVLLDRTQYPTTSNERFSTLLTGAILTGLPGAAIYALDLALPITFLASAAVGAAAIATPHIASATARLVRSTGIGANESDGDDQNVSR